MWALGALQRTCFKTAFRSVSRNQDKLGYFSRVISAFTSGSSIQVRSLNWQYRENLLERDLLVVDFDDTCTSGDSISHLVSATMLHQGGNADNESKQRLYQSLVQEYVSKRNDLMHDLLLPSTREREGEAWLQEFLLQTSAFDLDRNNVAIESRLLAGASMESLRDAARNVEFRPNCIETLLHALDRGMHVTVLSVNWSSEFIRSVFEHDGRLPLDTSNKSSLKIIANSLDFDADRTNGLLQTRLCQTAIDKFQMLKEMNAVYRSSIYVGDSITDIGSLLEASTGIIMGNDSLLHEVLHHAGVSVVPMDQWDAGEEPMTLYHAQCWDDIRKIHMLDTL